MKRIAALICALLLAAPFVSCGVNREQSDPESTAVPTAAPTPQLGPALPANTLAGTPYTYDAYYTEFPASWDIHSCTEDGRRIAELLNTPLVSLDPADIETGKYTWAYEAALSITDVTALKQEDLSAYQVVLREDAAGTAASGYVFRVELDPAQRWENGEPITARDHVESIKRLFDPERNNPLAAELLMSGAAPAGAERYRFAPREGSYEPVERFGYASNGEAMERGRELFIDMWGFWGLEDAVDAYGAKCPRWVSVNDTTEYVDRNFPAAIPISANKLWNDYSALFEVGAESAQYCAVYVRGDDAPSFEKTVGCYAEDDFTLIYVTAQPLSLDGFMEVCSHPWLVYLPYYDAAEEAGTDGQPAGFCTNIRNTMSCGPYRISYCRPGEAISLSRNPYWPGWDSREDGSPIAFTRELVNGERLQIYKTTRVNFKLMSHEAAKQAFDGGLLTEWRPKAEELSQYLSEDGLYVSPDPGTFRMFFNTDPFSLRRLDGTKGNRYSAVLSNQHFRRAISLAIDREAWCAALGGAPALGFISGVSAYDPFGSAASQYRDSFAGMSAICELYGAEYGQGALFGSIEEAYDSIDGYDPELSHELFKLAAGELAAEGLYREGDAVRIRVACSNTELDASDEKRIELLNRFVNEAAADTLFGAIEFQGCGMVEDPGAAVASGRYAMGFGRWRGSARYPFSAMRECCDTGLFDIPEAGCWDPSREALTLNVNGRDITLTWLDWSRSLSGEGALSAEKDELRLKVLAALEKEFLEKYYSIPICSCYKSVMLSKKAQYLTPDYSPAYGRGGFRFLVYNYTDEQWKAREE